jgi:hypothetical protein
VVRKIDTWSVLKVSALFFASLVLVLLIAGILLWAAGSVVGAIEGVEKFMRAIGFEDFRFVGTQLLRGFTAAGLVLVLLGTGLSVLVAVIYNLISDLVGGIELTVLEEDLRPAATSATAVVRGQDRTLRPDESTIAPGYPA